MNTENLLELIDKALKATNSVVDRSSYLTFEHLQIVKTTQVLNLLKESIERNPEEINERVLRGTRDLGMYSYKYFENTTLEDALCDVTEVLYQEISKYKDLKPLDLDFGKGVPI